MVKSIDEMKDTEEICNYCRYTEYGLENVNTGHWNLCEGSWCEDAYKFYLEQF